MKTCYKCKSSKPVSLFFKHGLTSDGLHSWCKVCCTEGNKKSREKQNLTITGRSRVFLQNAKRSAAKRGQEFSLTAENVVQFWESQDGICPYSGREMTLVAGNLHTVSIERIDSSKGYTLDNTVLVCQAVNRMKSDFSFDEFYSMCRDIAAFLGDDKFNLTVGSYK